MRFTPGYYGDACAAIGSFFVEKFGIVKVVLARSQNYAYTDLTGLWRTVSEETKKERSE